MPAPNDPFPNIAINLNLEQLDVLAAFTNAETELATNSAPPIAFLEIDYDGGGTISRTFDGQRVSSLSSAEQYRLYSQLGGLFNAAMRALLYP